MERNEPVDKTIMYVIVALGAFGAQLNIGNSQFTVDNLGTKGSFSAVVITLLSCFCYRKLKDIAGLSLKRYTIGMEGMCANAIQTFLPVFLLPG